jgi:D-3-phosphoglycerate dehydrogenase
MSMPTVNDPSVASICDQVPKLGQYDSVTSPLRAFVTAPLRGPGLDRLGAMADVIYEPWLEQTPLRIYDAEGLAGRLAAEDARLLVVESDLVSGPVFDLPLLAVAATRGDPNNVDLAAATQAGVPVLHTPGRNADAVAELAVGLLLAVTRRITVADTDARTGQVFRDGTIPYQRFRGWELAGRIAGLVGYGAVARALRWRLEGLGMTVLAADPYVAEATNSIEEILERCDVISLHAAVTPETRGMWDSTRFAAMRPGSIFLNTARASLHDTDALVASLGSGHLGGAALDHVDGEQLPDGHPLLDLPNVVLTPHIGGATLDTESRGAAMIAEDIERVLAGSRPIHIANPEVLR